jgi:ABC-type multidrug transport system ATPase subunit
LRFDLHRLSLPPKHPIKTKTKKQQYVVGEESKAFPTVGEVLTDPFIKLGKRLRAAVSDKHRREQAGGKHDVYALRNVSTVLAPSKLYLVIGGPKSGKTSFLKAIAGA